MSKILIWVLAGAIILTGGYFTLKQRGSDTDAPEETALEPGNGGADNQPEPKKMAFSEFVKQGGSYKCSVKQYLSDMDNQGTVYVSGEKMRGDFNTVAEGRPMETSFIFKDGYAYNWSSVLPNMGFKIKVEKNVEGNSTADESGTYSFDTTQIGDYSCESWTVDESKFVPPQNVTFNEVGGK